MPNQPSSSASPGTSKDIFTLESFSPVFVSSWVRETGICSICRNAVEGPCISCQSDAEATTWECAMSWGECGHAFHEHCIHRWLKTRQVCPLDNQPWVEKTEWNESQWLSTVPLPPSE